MKKFKILSKKKIFSFNDRFSIVKTRIELDGKQHDFGLREAEPFSIIIPQLNKDYFIMVRQHRLGADKISLEFPMGVVKGKNPQEVAIQELKEETGYRSNKLTPILTPVYLSPGWSTQWATIFLAQDLVEGEPTPEPYESIEISKIRIDHVDSLILDGTIFDMSTIASFYCYRNFLQKI